MNRKILARTLIIALGLLLFLGAKTAEANITNEINYCNNTTATLTLVNYSGAAVDPLGVFPAHTYSSEYWISTDPNGVEPACGSATPPSTIAPQTCGCFYVEARDVLLNEFNGAGGTMTYSIAPALPTTSPPLTATWAWSTPWSSQGFQSLLYPNGWWASGAVTAAAFGGNQVGLSEYGFTVGGADPGGQTVDFSLNGTAITVAMQSVVGATGMTAYVGGTGFNGGTHVYFNNVPALALSCTDNVCAATVPELGSVQNGDVAVTVVGVAGNAVAAGQYYELPDGPNCTYAPYDNTPTVYGSNAWIDPTCQQMSKWVVYYQLEPLAPGGWAPVGYLHGTAVVSTLGSTVGATTTYVACTMQANGQYPVPGENGCDAPTTVNVPWQVTIIHPPMKK